MADKKTITEMDKKIGKTLTKLIETQGFEKAFKKLGIKEDIVKEVKKRLSKEEKKEIIIEGELTKERFIKMATSFFEEYDLVPSTLQLETTALALQALWKGLAGTEIKRSLEVIAQHTRSTEAVSNAAKCLSKYEIGEAGKIAECLETVANSDLREAGITAAANRISKCKDPAEAVKTASYLKELAKEYPHNLDSFMYGVQHGQPE